MRRPHTSLKAIRNAKICEHYLAGHTLKQTAKAFDISAPRVWFILLDNNVPTRKPGRPRAA